MRGDSRAVTQRAARDLAMDWSEDLSSAREAGPTSEKAPKRTDELLRLVHHHPGYLRIRANAFLKPEADSSVVASAKSAVETVPGFRSWSLNPRTGSVVIQYDAGALDADDLLKHIATRAGFRGVEIATRSKTNRREVVSAFMDGVQDVNRVVSQLSGERADLRELVPVALLAASVVAFVFNEERGRLPHWFSTAYRSYRVFMHWHRREVRTRERAAREAEERAGFDTQSGGAK